MKRILALLVALSTASAAFAQVDGRVAPGTSQSADVAKPAPHQSAGPVHIRFRKASDIKLVAGTDEAEVRRELAYHAALHAERSDD